MNNMSVKSSNIRIVDPKTNRDVITGTLVNPPTHDDYGKANSCTNKSNNENSIVEITKVSYKEILVGIYADYNNKANNQARRFYFEPIVILDPKSILNESEGFLKRDFVRFTIQMWNQELRSKVLERLLTMPSLIIGNNTIQEEDVCVMPYEEVQLVFKAGSIHSSFQVTSEPVSYLRSKESLDFYFLCDLNSTAKSLADNFRRNPEFMLKSWQMKLECRGLALMATDGTASIKPRSFSINVMSSLSVSSQTDLQKWAQGLLDALLPRCADQEKQIKELQSKMLKLESSMKKSHNHEAITVFSVSCNFNPVRCVMGSPRASWLQAPTPKTCLAYSKFNSETKRQHGDFDLESGLFTVRTSGFYQMEFKFKNDANRHHQQQGYKGRVELLVDGITKAIFSQVQDSPELLQLHNMMVFHPVIVLLKKGEKVGVYLAVDGQLNNWSYSGSSYQVSVQFSGSLLAD